jgi:hypothetical protein
MPQVCAQKKEQGPTARSIGGEIVLPGIGAARGWDGLSALHFVLASRPGALPQAGMGTRLWRCNRKRIQQSDQIGSDFDKAVKQLPPPKSKKRGGKK